MRRPIRTAALIVAFILAAAIFAGWVESARAACRPEPVTPDTPTGIAGCVRWGEGTASHYGPGSGVAVNWCTWTLRHRLGCGSVRITSLDTGRSVTAPVVDYCDCLTTTPRERIIDLQYGVVHALGLNLAAGLYAVRVEPVVSLPDTAMR